jgi:hypothetical protein
MNYLIKKISFVCAAAIALSVASASIAAADVKPLDHGLPWPWALAVNVPLKDLRGVWTVVGVNKADYFVFDVRSSKDGGSFINITSYDPYTCTVRGHGVGYQNDRYIYGQIVSTKGQSYSLSVYAFNKSDVISQLQADNSTKARQLLDAGLDDLVMAMAMAPVNSTADHKAYEIRRVSTDAQVCPHD